MLDLLDLFRAVQCAVLAIVLYRLMQPGMIFGAWGKVLARKQWDWPAWVRKPLGDCYTCFSGQIGLWSGIGLELYRHYSAEIIFEPTPPPLVADILRLIFHVVFVIYLADILNFHGNRNQTTG